MNIMTKLAIVSALLAGSASGSEVNRYPILGGEWAEWTYYNPSGKPVGGKRVECDGFEVTWGTLVGRMDYKLARCGGHNTTHSSLPSEPHSDYRPDEGYLTTYYLDSTMTVEIGWKKVGYCGPNYDHGVHSPYFVQESWQCTQTPETAN